jgi:aminoglycoside 2''-adenylyltransferase
MHTAFIHQLMSAAAARELPLWFSGGWAIDARLGRITRPHEDIDIVFPAERRAEVLALLAVLGGGSIETTDYGFLIMVNGVLIDCEPCIRRGDVYELDGPPPGTCPWDAQGVIAGMAVRCVSWEAILWDYFDYRDEVPLADWRSKDHESYALARMAYGETATDELHRRFRGGVTRLEVTRPEGRCYRV